MDNTLYFLQLEAIKVKCAEFECDITLDEATAKQAELKESRGELRIKTKALQAKLNKHTKRLQTMMQKKNKMKEEYLNIQKKVYFIMIISNN